MPLGLLYCFRAWVVDSWRARPGLGTMTLLLARASGKGYSWRAAERDYVKRWYWGIDTKGSAAGGRSL